MLLKGALVKGLNVISTGTNVVADGFFNLVSLLLPGNGTNGKTNNTFLDSSANNFTVTRNGNTTQGTFTPFSQTGWSNYFDGSGDYLTVPYNTNTNILSGDFTVECWVNATAIGGNRQIGGQWRQSTGQGGWQLGIDASGFIGVAFGAVSEVANIITSSVAITANTWNHIALVRNGSVFTLYINGVSRGTATSAATRAALTGVPTTFGNYLNSSGAFPASGSTDFAGYLSNYRIVKGTAVYTADFTPPTVALTAITGTGLLICQSNRFIDNSTSALAITITGSTAVQPYSPFDPTSAYSTATIGGSGYFDGSGDFLTVPDNNALDGFGDFTIEFWVYFTNATNQTILQKYSSSSGFSTYIFYVTSGNLLVYMSDGSSWLVSGAQAITGVVTNQWYHIAVSRSGSTFNIFRNGAIVATASSSSALQSDTGIVNIAQQNGGGGNFYGYLSGLRIIKGTAVYTAAFTPPTAPLTAIPNTSLLLNFTNAGITDATAKNVLETLGDAKISTAQSKWGGSSMAFDGTGDYLIVPPTNGTVFGNRDFTVEAWVYPTATQTQFANIMCNANNPNGWFLSFGTSNLVTFSSWNVTAITSSSGLPNNAWTHVAVSRVGTTIRMFFNGVQVASATNSTSYGVATSTNYIGFNTQTHYFLGYLQDLRVTQGMGRYTGTFTPPTVPFALQ